MVGITAHKFTQHDKARKNHSGASATCMLPGSKRYHIRVCIVQCGWLVRLHISNAHLHRHTWQQTKL